MDAKCDGPNCKELKTQSYALANACTVTPKVKESVDGCEFLPLCLEEDPMIDMLRRAQCAPWKQPHRRLDVFLVDP
jgi:hypothetical protein